MTSPFISTSSHSHRDSLLVTLIIFIVALALVWGVWGARRQQVAAQAQLLQMQENLATSLALETGVLQPQPVITATAVITSSKVFIGGISNSSLQLIQPEELFLTPVVATDIFNKDSAWMVAEPGVFLNATATFDRGSSQGDHFVQCPEGGFAYASLGAGEMAWDGGTWQAVSEAGTNNILLVRCRVDDDLQDSDLNVILKFSGYTPGNIITSPMPAGAYVSSGWMRQQLEMSSLGLNGQSGANCGASGCTRTYVYLIDIDSSLYQVYLVRGVAAWSLVYSNDR